MDSLMWNINLTQMLSVVWSSHAGVEVKLDCDDVHSS